MTAPTNTNRPPASRLPSLALALLTLLFVALDVGRAAAGNGPESRGSIAGGLAADDFHAPDAQLRELVAALLERNPRLDALWRRSAAGFERAVQQRSLPDPQLTYRFFARTPETRVGPQQHALELSQGLPGRGKRDLDARGAQSAAAATTWEAAAVERQLVAGLKRAYFEIAYLQEALRVNREERELLEKFERIALRRYSTGEGIQQSIVKVQTDLSRLEDREYALRQLRDDAGRRIAELTGAPDAPLTLAAVSLPLPEIAFDRARLEELAIGEHPRVRALERQVEADALSVSRRKLEGRPDFRIGVGYTVVGKRDDPAGIATPPEDNGQDVVALSAGIEIPMFRKRIRAGVAEARENELASARALEAERNRLRLEVQRAVLRAEALGRRARLVRDVIVPQAEESLASAESAYTTDRLGFLDLLDAERVLFESRLAYHRLVSDLWIALTDLEAAIARPFPAERPPTSAAVRTDGGGPS